MKRFRTIIVILLIAILMTSIPLFAKWAHERQTATVELGDVTADDAWISGKNWATYGAIIIDSIGFMAEGYNGTTGDYAAIGDSTVFFTLSLLTFGADTGTLAVYESYLDTLTAATEWVTMTIQSGHDTIKAGDVVIFNYQETDTAGGVLAIRDAIVSFTYQRIK